MSLSYCHNNSTSLYISLFSPDPLRLSLPYPILIIYAPWDHSTLLGCCCSTCTDSSSAGHQVFPCMCLRLKTSLSSGRSTLHSGSTAQFPRHTCTPHTLWGCLYFRSFQLCCQMRRSNMFHVFLHQPSIRPLHPHARCSGSIVSLRPFPWISGLPRIHSSPFRCLVRPFPVLPCHTHTGILLLLSLPFWIPLGLPNPLLQPMPRNSRCPLPCQLFLPSLTPGSRCCHRYILSLPYGYRFQLLSSSTCSVRCRCNSSLRWFRLPSRFRSACCLPCHMCIPLPFRLARLLSQACLSCRMHRWLSLFLLRLWFRFCLPGYLPRHSCTHTCPSEPARRFPLCSSPASLITRWHSTHIPLLSRRGTLSTSCSRCRSTYMSWFPRPLLPSTACLPCHISFPLYFP